MGITRLSIENFKGVGTRQIIDIAKLTLLFGPNSAGKSTILHALNYLNDIVCHQDPGSDSTRLGEDAMDLGGFRQFVHKHELHRVVSLGLDMKLEEFDLYETRANRTYRLQREMSSPEIRGVRKLIDISLFTRNISLISYDFKIAWSDVSEQPYVQQVTFGFEGKKFATIKSSSDGRRTNIEYLDLLHPALKSYDDADGSENWGHWALAAFSQRHLQGGSNVLIGLENASQAILNWREPMEISDVWDEDADDSRGPLEVTALLECLIRGSLEALAEELGGLQYLGPLRGLPERNYRPNPRHAANWATGLGAWDILYRDRALLNNVNHWLSESRLNCGYQVESTDMLEIGLDSQIMGWLNATSLDANRIEIQRALAEMLKRRHLVLRDVARNVQVQPNDVGIGISQMMPVVVGALANEVRIFSIEQPEIHIHPRLQVQLGDLFIQAAKELDKLFLIETHSEHLILRLLKRIREASDAESIMSTNFSADDIRVLYVECIDGETRISPLRISESGRFIDRWPDGFFEERYAEQD